MQTVGEITTSVDCMNTVLHLLLLSHAVSLLQVSPLSFKNFLIDPSGFLKKLCLRGRWLANMYSMLFVDKDLKLASRQFKPKKPS